MQKHRFLLPGAISAALVLSLFSCSEKSKTDDVVRQMEESLINSNKAINLSTEINLKALEEKTTEPATMERAKIWFVKAEQVVKLSHDMYNYLENVKTQLKENKFSTDLLYQQLVSYNVNVLETDTSISQEFRNSFSFPKEIRKTKISAALTILQNKIKILENKIIAYCHLKVGSTDGDGFFDSFSAIVAQSSNYLKPGEQLEITAGVGAFSKSGQPKIIINQTQLELGEEGYVTYKFKTTQKPGNYKIPVKISFLNPTTGKDEFKTIDVEYTVAKPCN